MARKSAVWLVNGFAFGISFAASSELYRVYRGSSKLCEKCHAPVGTDGQWRGEREPRSYSIAWGVRDGEWAAKQRLARRKKCFGCQKSLDVSSVIVLDRAWHRKCLLCTGCKKPLSGNRYYMFDNRVYDKACFHKARNSPTLQSAHTSIIDLRYPAPVSSDDHRVMAPTDVASLDKSTVQTNHNNNDIGKMSHDMKKRLANDLLNALMSLRTREQHLPKSSESTKSTDSETLKKTENDDDIPVSVASRRQMFEKGISAASDKNK